VTASNGGLLPWQVGWATRFGRFQFVLGRELGATFYGYGFDVTTVMTGATPEPARGSSRSSRSTSTCRSSNTALSRLRHEAELGGARAAVRGRRRSAACDGHVAAGCAGGQLNTVYSIGLRLIFDWRHYF
jgi:hypothetical protein